MPADSHDDRSSEDKPLSSDARRFVVRRLATQRANGEPVGTCQVRFAAKNLGISERTLWRDLARCGPPKKPESRSHALTEEEIECYYRMRGNVRGVWRELSAKDPACPSRWTLQRAFGQLSPAERKYAMDGEDGWRAHQVHLRWEAEARNQIWQADHKEIPVWVIPPHGTKPVKAWITVFLDCYSREVQGYAVNLIPTAADVMAALHAAIMPDPELGPGCGIPDAVMWDGGKEFLSDAVDEVTVTLGCLARPVKAHSPYLKGKIERFNRTLDQQLSSRLPGYTKGPRKADGRLYGPGELLTFQELLAQIRAWIIQYNNALPHEALGGRTPAQAWDDDPAPVSMLAAEDARWMLKASRRAKITKSGIRHANHLFIAPELSGLAGDTVELRFIPHDHRFVDVYVGRKFLCTALPQATLTAAERDAVLARRKEDRRKAGARMRRAGRAMKARLEPSTGTRPPATVTRMTAAQAGQARGPRQLSKEASLEGLGLEGINEAQPAGDGAGGTGGGEGEAA